MEAANGSTQAPDPEQVDSANCSIRVLGLGGQGNSLAVPRCIDPNRAVLSYDKVMVNHLCQVYLRQVDPVIKILHRPSLEKWMLQGEAYLGYPDGHASVTTLRSAVFYSAASSMTKNQCQAMFNISKFNVLTNCRRDCEVAIQRSSLLVTRDITVLQAFVLYLVSTHFPPTFKA